MNQRARIAMSEDEVTAFLAESRKLQLGTINPDGTPHLVTMFYGLLDGRIAFWTYAKAQKRLNIERDPRVSCLVEVGDDYFGLRGVLVYGTARLMDEREAVLSVGMTVTRRMTGLAEDEVTEDIRAYVEHTGRKRVAYVVEPGRVVSWDHRKLATGATA
ncbi:pyridoxamine 5'-phosphate oxidase [Sphaerisporangium album]|uniref:Pyridoxamine 5'-phosphate oxidase n=1 Tax=Sphaerisporangium album TaxID=509200 RepID=A0A367FPZ2_9ACTN|nr:pyridoxamine 5'-phosphate oxidase family protein [Sphaerisporangium album]RCG32351.1 pyridoxamine 5'-phosphate oxidase [Sphaerisporangium album]